MSYSIYMEIKGKKSGLITGYSSNKMHEKWIEVLGYEHTIVAPMDLGSHQSSGRVQNGVISVRKPIDVATPVLFQALAEHELLETVKFEFWGSGSTAVGNKFLDVVLYDALVTHCEMHFWPEKPMTTGGGALETGKGAMMGGIGGGSEILCTQVIKIGYQKITWEATSFDIKGLKVAGPKKAEVAINQF